MSSIDLSPNAITGVLDKGVAAAFDGARESLKTLKFASYSFQKGLESSVYPAVSSLIDINQQVMEALFKAATFRRPVAEVMLEFSDRASSAARFSHLVQTLGKELFGTAHFPGEIIIAEDGPYRLVHIPGDSAAGKQEVAVFHAGGAIPYSDRIFRILPEANLFLPFHKRGVGLYVMELRGDKHEIDYSNLTMDILIGTFERLTAIAFKHNEGKKMVLEGYCGHAMQAMSYVAAHPEDANEKFSAIATFVAPIDGRECSMIAELVQNTPDYLQATALGFWRMFGGYLPGSSVQVGLDLPLRTLSNKSPLGYAVTGWNRSEYSAAKRVEDLKPFQRRELAGAYWLSPENSSRYPIPVDLVKYAADLFTKGIGNDGSLPLSHEGRKLSLQDIKNKTNLKILGFFGGKDVIVPDRTAHILVSLFRDRYHHVVHPFAGHISYVLTPEIWEKSDAPASLAPNPIDLILEAGKY